jgi:hypothetical protein
MEQLINAQNKVCFDIYFKDGTGITKSIAKVTDIRDFLLYHVFLQEIKASNPCVFRQMLALITRANYSYLPMIASF